MDHEEVVVASAPSHEDDSDEDDVAISSQPKKGLQLLETVGTGGYGVVYRAIWHGQLIAAKVIEHDDTRGDGLITKDDSFCPFERGDTADGGGAGVQINNSLTEGALSLIMNHPNIVRSLGYEAIPKLSPDGASTHEIRLLMEFCDKGSLDKQVAGGCFHDEVDGVVRIKLPHVLKTLLETAYAMRHLHNMHILHRDLKIQNVLLKSSNKDSRGFTVKVSDFGLAKIWDGRGRGNSPSEKQKYAGTVTHMAPELIERGEVSTACDVYAFGILMWEMYTRLQPYKGLGPPQVLMGVVSSQLRPAFASTTPQGFQELARWCWAQSPQDRPTFSQVAKYLCLLLEGEEED